MKKLVAYSSVAHMGFVTLGFFIFNDLGVVRRHRADDLRTASSRARCSFASACCTTACIRARSRPTAAWSTPCPSSPRLAVLFAMANCGLPGTAGFVGEWMVILGAVKANFWLGALAATDADLRRRLHAVDVQARLLRRRSPTTT